MSKTAEMVGGDLTNGASGAPRVNGGAARAGGKDHSDPGRLSSRILVGRERELELLLEAAISPPALVLVEGEAGVGKTRLVQEALSDPSVRSRHVIVGHCHRLREPFPLGPVVEALRSAEPPPGLLLSPVVGALQPLLPELAHVLPEEPTPIGDRRAERHRVFRALRELIDAFGPTACLLEDLHWADEGTLEFLAFLLSQPPEGLSIVLTYRGEDLRASSPLLGLPASLPRDSVKMMLELAPLSLEEVRTLTGTLLDASAVSEDLAERLRDRTAGIPFALEEVVHLLRDRGQLTLTDDGGAVGDLQQVDVPTVIRQAIRERMEIFTADARHITRAGAVLALPASEHLLTRVAGLSPARAIRGLTRALSSALVEEKGAGVYGLRHALSVQAVYDEIPPPERRRLHQRAGEALESSPGSFPPAQLAHHFQQADRPKQWARYAEAAADAARGVGDERVATRFLEQALSARGISRTARVRLAIKLGSSARHSDCPEKAIGLLQRILEEEPMAVGVRGELRFGLAQLRYYVGDGGLWHEEMVRAAGELGRRPELAARAMVQLAWPMLREGPVEDDLAWLQRAVDAAGKADDPVTRAGIPGQRAAILLSIGDPAGWAALEDIPQAGDSVEEKLQLLRGYQGLAGVVRGLGYYRRSEAFLEEVIRIDRELDHVWWDPWRESARVALDWALGRWDGLDPRARKLAGGETGTATLAVASELVLGSLLLSRGQIEEAEGIFTSVLKESQRRGWLGARVAASAGLARLRLAGGDARGARHVAALGLDVVRHKEIWIWGKEVVPVAVQALLACQNPAEARDLATRYATGIHGRDAPAAHAASHACQATVAEATGSSGDAARHFQAAERGWSELPCPYEVAKAREQRARCLLAEDDEAGVDLLLDALDVFDGLQAGWDATRIRATLRAQGITPSPPSRGGRKAYGDELSPREAEVARLAGTGRKNREIAETLFISPRTVEAHVASAIRKLGVESRQALATVAGAWAETKSTKVGKGRKTT